MSNFHLHGWLAACIAAMVWVPPVGVSPLTGQVPPARPLDLPVSGVSKDTEDDETASEQITFFGASYEGDAFFFLLDKSGSMVGEKMLQLKQELTNAISSLSSASEIGLVAYSSDIVRFHPRPRPATPGTKTSAIAWVLQLDPVGATMMLDGALAVLPIAHLSRRQQRVIIAVGDGIPNSPGPAETLEGIITANWQSLPWNTVLIGSVPEAATFMMTLAQSTGGTFRNP